MLISFFNYRALSLKSAELVKVNPINGTGLFLSSGYTINQAGPIGTMIAYLIGGRNLKI
ncbi:hypothetical protein KFD70_18170 [Bacillus pfraonensis]|nr:hypothetical protein [Bacillus pseudomycoides]